jgi:hypothetical protein
MEHWQEREKHELDLRKLYKDLGFLDDHNFPVRFDSRKFWPAWSALGHDHTEFAWCWCNSNNAERHFKGLE